MPKIIINSLSLIFIDLFPISLIVPLVSISLLVFRRFFGFNYSYQLAVIIWNVLIAAAGIIAAIMLIEFFSYDKGIERLALVPLILGASPLFLSALVSLFLLPKK
jgi:hypothetical protein